MPGSEYSLKGTISIDASRAIAQARSLAQQLDKLNAASSGMNTGLRATSGASAAAASGIQKEGSASRQTATQIERANKVRRESLALTRKINATTAGVKQGTADKTLESQGRRALTDARALTEATRQRVAIESAGDQKRSRLLRDNIAQQRLLIGVARQQVAAESAASQIKSRNVRDQIAQQRLLLDSQRALASGSRAQVGSLQEVRGALSSAGTSALVFGAVLTGAYVGAIRGAITMEREFVNVARTSDVYTLDSAQLRKRGFATQAEAVASLKLQFDALAQALPVTYSELTEIGTAAGQLGVTSNNLANFTQTVAEFSATTGVSVDTASTAFGRLDSLIGDVVVGGQKIGGVDHNYRALADSILNVGVNSVATETQIINIASQISGVANAAGFTKDEIVGLSGALASVGVSPYLARGLTTRLFTNLGNAVANGGDKLKNFADVSGVTSSEFAAQWNKSRSGALVLLLDGIAAKGGDAVNVLQDLGVKSVLDQPALIRLARAADKFGDSADISARKGGILRQQLADAAEENSSGALARQYSKIAETLQARLQVAANRAQILLRNLATTNLGPLGDSIDFISNNLLIFSQNLEKPVKLLGGLDIPFLTNGQLLGSILALTGFAGVLTLLVGGALRFGAAMIALGQAFTAARGFVQGGIGSLRGYAAQAATATTATNALAASTERLARVQAQSKLSTGMVNYQTGIQRATLDANRIKASNSAFAGPSAKPYLLATAAANKFQASNNRAVQALGKVATGGVRAGAAVSNGLRTAGAAAGGLARGIGGLFAGPAGIITLALGAVAGIAALSNRVKTLGTDADVVAIRLASAGTAAKALFGIKIDSRSGIASGLEDLFGAGGKTDTYIKNTKQLEGAIKDLGGGGFFGDLGKRMQDFLTPSKDLGTNILRALAPIPSLLAGAGGGFDNTTKQLQKFNDGFKSLADSDPYGALEGAKVALGGLSRQAITLALQRGELADVRKEIVLLLNQNGLDGTEQNIQDVIKGVITLGGETGKAAARQAELVDAFHGDQVAAQDFTEAVKKNLTAATDFNSIWSNIGKDVPDPFAEFIKQAKQASQDFADSQRNALQIAADTGADLTTLMAQDPGILAGAVKGGKKAEKQLYDILQLPDADANINAGAAKIASNTALNSAFNELGKGARDKILKAFGEGAGVEDAFAAAGEKGKAALAKAVQGGYVIEVPVEVSINKLPSDIGTPGFAGVPDYFKVKVDADTSAAKGKVDAFSTLVGGLAPQVDINGNADPAKTALQGVVGSVTQAAPFLSILGNNNPALQALGFVVQGVTGSNPLMKIGADAAAAIKAGDRAAANAAGKMPIFGIGANAASANATASKAAANAAGKKPVFKIDGNPGPANAKSDSAARYANTRRATITVGASVQGALDAIGSVVNRAWTATVKVLTGKAGGGIVHGPGTGTSDSIPTRLSDGEYVIRAKQVKKYKSLLDQINYGVGGYATGGMVTGGSARYEGTVGAVMAPSERRREGRSLSPSVVELSAADRHLLQTVADRVGVTIAPDHIAGATSSTYRTQARRGNG